MNNAEFSLGDVERNTSYHWAFRFYLGESPLRSLSFSFPLKLRKHRPAKGVEAKSLRVEEIILNLCKFRSFENLKIDCDEPVNEHRVDLYGVIVAVVELHSVPALLAFDVTELKGHLWWRHARVRVGDRQWTWAGREMRYKSPGLETTTKSKENIFYF